MMAKPIAQSAPAAAMIGLFVVGVILMAWLFIYDEAVSRDARAYQLSSIVSEAPGGNLREDVLPIWADCRHCQVKVRIEVPRPVEAVLISAVESNAQVSVNGRPLIVYGSMTGLVTDNSRNSLFWRLPNVEPGTDESPVIIDIIADRRFARPRLMDVYAGPVEPLAALSNWTRFIKVHLPAIGMILTGFCAILALAVIPLFRERLVLWASAALMAVWCSSLALPVALVNIISVVFAGWYYIATTSLLLLTSSLFAFAWIKRSRILAKYIDNKYFFRVSVFIISVLVLMPVYQFLGYDSSDITSNFTRSVWMFGTIALPIIVFNAVLVLASYINAPRSRWPEFAVLVLLHLSAGADVILTNALNRDGVLIYAVSILFPILLILSLAARASDVFEAANLNTVKLAQRVSDREAEIRVALREKHEKALELDRERQRMSVVREVHDTTGARLLGLLLAARQGEVDRTSLLQSLQIGLDEMRLLIHSLESSRVGLAQPLAVLRQQIERAAQATGIQVNWSVDGETVRPAPAAWVLNICRLLQQAAMNSVEHSNATRMDVRLVVTASQIEFCVSDNGVGLPDKAELERRPLGRGRGLEFMRSRANELEGELEITSDEGTTVTFCASVPPPQDSLAPTP